MLDAISSWTLTKKRRRLFKSKSIQFNRNTRIALYRRMINFLENLLDGGGVGSYTEIVDIVPIGSVWRCN